LKDDIFWLVLKLEISYHKSYNMNLEGFWFLLEDFFLGKIIYLLGEIFESFP
jgi:hypothetical protein